MAPQDAREPWLYSTYDLFNLKERKKEKETKAYNQGFVPVR